MILPQTTEATPGMSDGLDPYLDKAGESIGRIVVLHQKIMDCKDEVLEKAAEVQAILPEGNASGRLAMNYSMILHFAGMVGIWSLCIMYTHM